MNTLVIRVISTIFGFGALALLAMAVRNSPSKDRFYVALGGLSIIMGIVIWMADNFFASLPNGISRNPPGRKRSGCLHPHLHSQPALKLVQVALVAIEGVGGQSPLMLEGE